jgi:Mg2+ and Co2+ transporter CorA
LAVAAASWNQVLNYLEGDIDNCQRIKPADFSGGLAQLQYNISLIKDFQSAISDNRHTVRDQGGRDWPWPNEHSRDDTELIDAKRMKKIKAKLLRDYDELSTRCQDLLRRCEATSTQLQGRIAIQEAQRSVEQAALVGRFTQLAFLFIPLSFVAAVFGMNVAEIQAAFPPIWTFFLVATVVLITSMVFAMTTEQRRSLLDQAEALLQQANARLLPA